MAVVNLGDRVRDRVSGFEGIADSFHVYLQGCRRIGIQPRVGKDGKMEPAVVFDEPNLEVLEEKVVPASEEALVATLELLRAERQLQEMRLANEKAEAAKDVPPKVPAPAPYVPPEPIHRTYGGGGPHGHEMPDEEHIGSEDDGPHDVEGVRQLSPTAR